MTRLCCAIIAWSLVAGLACGQTAKSHADVTALAGQVDRLVEARWKEKKIKPAAPADDATFLRRVHLDIAGRIPSITETRDFLEDPAPDKRLRLVERLLKSETHARHFATVTRKLLLPETFAAAASPLDGWLERRIGDDVRLDRLARELLTAKAVGTADPALNAFYQANEFKPENLAASASRIFLGIRLECAQCHDHPFAPYSRKSFWEFAAFFAGVDRPGALAGRGKLGEITIPNTDKTVRARLPGGTEMAFNRGDDPRTAVADWLAREDNPYFARAAVNRLWAHFLGHGLVEPLDQMSEENKPSHPELLDELAKAFVASGFDMRFLVRAITATRAYQLSSASATPADVDDRLFARMVVRGLSAEQLYDSIAQATWKTPGGRGSTEPFGPRATFLARFAGQESLIDRQTSILQALHLMNGKPMADAIDFDLNRALRTLAEARGQSTAQRIEELYLTTLSRRPLPAETERLVKYVEQGGPRKDQRKALSDVLWALLNSPEFVLNH